MLGNNWQNLFGMLYQGHQIVAIIEDGTVQSPENVNGRETYTLSKMGMPNRMSLLVGKKSVKRSKIFKMLDFGAKLLFWILSLVLRLKFGIPTPLDIEDLD